MKKYLIMLVVFGLGAGAAWAAGGVGVFGSYLDGDDSGPGFGGGVKFKAELAEFLAVEARASCLTQFDEWEGDDELFVIPIEGALVFNLPLQDTPLTIYAGGGAGYAIIPEADDIDYDDSFCFFGLGGVEIAMGETASLFAEVQYRVLEVDGADYDGSDVDFGDDELKFTGIGVNAGLLFRW